MVHGDAIAETDGWKFHWRATGAEDTSLDGAGDLIEVEMAWNDFVLGVDDADQRFFQIVGGVAHGIEQGTVRRTCRPLFDFITSHRNSHLHYKNNRFT